MDSSARQWLTERAGEVFSSSDSQSVAYRQSHSMTIADSTTGQLITNTPTCHKVGMKVRRQLKNLFVPAVTIESFEPLYFRFGDYYAVLLMPNRDKDPRQTNSYTAMLIYRARDLEYVGLVLL